ncbi:hypothetical protein HYV84_03655 [Candidatus Woesearchaeota archaeon]|nr:hypothetical protein [Candidatus Woesearchaeota archaeon]
MLIERHILNLEESDEVIRECIEKGIAKRQRTIGFNTSAAAADMIEILLHKKRLIDPGFLVKHEWFNSDRKIKEKFPFDFDRKDEIIGIIKKIEGKRNMLCYGKQQKDEVIRDVLLNYQKLKEIYDELVK